MVFTARKSVHVAVSSTEWARKHAAKLGGPRVLQTCSGSRHGLTQDVELFAGGHGDETVVHALSAGGASVQDPPLDPWL